MRVRLFGVVVLVMLATPLFTAKTEQQVVS